MDIWTSWTLDIMDIWTSWIFGHHGHLDIWTSWTWEHGFKCAKFYILTFETLQDAGFLGHFLLVVLEPMRSLRRLKRPVGWLKRIYVLIASTFTPSLFKGVVFRSLALKKPVKATWPFHSWMSGCSGARGRGGPWFFWPGTLRLPTRHSTVSRVRSHSSRHSANGFRHIWLSRACNLAALTLSVEVKWGSYFAIWDETV